MEPILTVAKNHGLPVVEDNAQAIGADYTYRSGKVQKAGTMGQIGTTSFFPSKNLGCYGDGGALFTNDDDIADQLRMIANHGQSRRYYHDCIGVNSRLDTLQAAILNVKLKYLGEYSAARQSVASYYDDAFSKIDGLQIPVRQPNSTHVFHQYTLRVKNGKREDLIKHLANAGIPANIYYPVPLYKQKAFAPYYNGKELPVTEQLCREVVSLPIHTEMDEELLGYITSAVQEFFEYWDGFK
jgi:dTDP-4-amino-4,6-dideoxygalactose transaminase